MTATHQESRINRHNIDIATAVQEKQLALNMSQLMGCDYIFIPLDQTQDFFNTEYISSSIQGLLGILKINPHQTVIILVDEKATPRFSRADFTWNHGHIEKTAILPITTEDQIEFMEMMLDCSTLY